MTYLKRDAGSPLTAKLDIQIKIELIWSLVNPSIK